MDNWWFRMELERMRHEDKRRQAEHDRLMAANGLDLWSVLRRAIKNRVRSAAPRHEPTVVPSQVASNSVTLRSCRACSDTAA